MSSSKDQVKSKSPMIHLISGGCAGFVESSICHPLDTIKTRMQLRRGNHEAAQVVQTIRHSLVEPVVLRIQHSLTEPGSNAALKSSVETGTLRAATLHEPLAGRLVEFGVGTSALPKPPPPPTVTSATAAAAGSVPAAMGPLGTARRIVQREGFLALYKGLSAVYSGIIPKMAIRFLSFEQYREWLVQLEGRRTTRTTFVAGLACGITEAVVVVTPAEVCKIRMQSQFHSLMDPKQLSGNHSRAKYRNVVQTCLTIVREEGVAALYKGVVPTMLRQGINQAVNFTCYNAAKVYILESRGKGETQLPHWQSLVIGGLSGGVGPLVNNPIDVVKTRLQKQTAIIPKSGKAPQPKYTGMVQATMVIAREEGVGALWKGITPRLLRIVPGQAITFMTYEAVSSRLLALPKA